jgi:predicted transcriptional regulator of viral defense system
MNIRGGYGTMSEISVTERLLRYVQEKGIIRAGELDSISVPRIYLTRLVRKGFLERISRGLYRLPDSEITEHFTLLQAAKKVPQGVVCLVSALSFHNMTTQIPHQIWMAVERGKWEAGMRDLPIRIFEFSGQAFYEGIENHLIDGVHVRVYNVAKTVADCFKYRNKVGLDVAMEALWDALRQRKCTADEIWYYAHICRVANVMRPYLEATV